MNPWSYLLPVALIAVVASLFKLIHVTSSRNASAILGLVFFAICLVFNTQSIYLALDPLLGGTNIMYLFVQLSFILAMFFMKGALVPSRDKSDRPRTFLRSDIVTVAVALVVECVFFNLAPMPTSAYRVEPYRGEWQVIAFTEVVNIYSAWVAVPIVRETIYFARSAKQRLTVRWGAGVLSVGFTIGILTALSRLLLQGLYTASDPATRTAMTTFDGYLVVALLLCIAVGWTMVFIGNRKRIGKERAAKILGATT